MSPERRQYESLEELIQEWRVPEPSPDFIERTLQRLETEPEPLDAPRSWRRPLRVPLGVAIAVAAVALVSLALNVLTWRGLREESRETRRADRQEAPAVAPDLYALHEPLPETAGTVILLPVVPGARCEPAPAPSNEAIRIQRSRAW